MRFLSGFSVLAMLVAMLIVVTSSLEQTKSFLGPAGSESGKKGVSRAIGSAQNTGFEQRINALYKEAVLESVSGVTSESELTANLSASEPQSQIGEKLVKGGTAIRLVGEDVEFCGRAIGGQVFTCGRGYYGQPATAIHWGRGDSLGIARKKAAAANAPTSPNEIVEGSGGSSAINKARKVTGG